MDITQWLEDTAAAARAKQPKCTVVSSGPLAVPAAPTNPVRHPSKRRMRGRGRSGGDSSTLAPEDTPPDALVKRVDEATSCMTDAKLLPTSDELTELVSHSGVSESSAHRSYGRRKRRKTNANKYDLKSGTARNITSKPRNEKSKGNGKKSKHKVERRRGRGEAEAIVRNFKAPNVRNARLTLQSAINLGLFRHGRASSPFKGQGMPDLAFSQMGFLQHRKSLHDAAIPTESDKVRRTREKTRQTEEDISAYFAPSRPPLEGADVGDLSVRRRGGSSGPTHRQVIAIPRRNVAEASLTRKSVDSIAKPHTSTRKTLSKTSSASYYSWPTSEPLVLAATETKDLPGVRHSVEKCNPQAKHVGHVAASLPQIPKLAPHERVRRHELSRIIISEISAGGSYEETKQNQHKKRPSLGPVDEGHLSMLGDGREHEIPPLLSAETITESLPLPSSPPHRNQLGRDAHTSAVDTSEPLLQKISQAQAGSASCGQQSSTTLDRLLKDCDAYLTGPPDVNESELQVEEALERDVQAVHVRDEERTVATMTNNDATMISEADLRRDWRIQGKCGGYVDTSRKHNIEIDGDISHVVTYEAARDQPYSVQSAMDLEGQLYEYDPTAGHSEFDLESLEADADLVSVDEDDGCYGECESDDGALDGFWRPNILY